MKVSIIIPHYNSLSSLEKLVESIPTNNLIETIIIDDHSSPKIQSELFELKRKYTDKNIKVMSNEKNKKGAGACRNKGLEMAKGEWILFADDDDLFFVDLVDKIEKYLDSDDDVIFFKPTSIDINSKRISDRHKPYETLIKNYQNNNNRKNEIKLLYSYVVPWSKLINKNFLNKFNIRFDEVMVSNDVMFSTKVGYFCKKFKVSDEVIYCVTKREGSLTTTNNVDRLYIRLEVFIRFYKFLEKNLAKKDFNILKLNGFKYIIHGFQYNLATGLKILRILLNKNIAIVRIKKRFLNPYWLLNKTIKKIYFKFM